MYIFVEFNSHYVHFLVFAPWQGLELAFAGKALGALAAFGVGRSVGCEVPRYALHRDQGTFACFRAFDRHIVTIVLTILLMRIASYRRVRPRLPKCPRVWHSEAFCRNCWSHKVERTSGLCNAYVMRQGSAYVSHVAQRRFRRQR